MGYLNSRSNASWRRDASLKVTSSISFCSTHIHSMSFPHGATLKVPYSSAVQREKQGFSAPDESWFWGESMDYVRDRLLDRAARIYDWMDYDTVTGLIEEHLSGQRNRRLLIWSLLYVEEWSRCFLGAHAYETRAASLRFG